jgi:mono/diheme cytochrome c family protein
VNRIEVRLADAWRWLVISALLIAGTQAGFAADQQARERGSSVFQTHGCLRCHSITGVGGDRGPDLGSVALRRGPGQIRRQIVHGGHGMPPFGGVLNRREIDDLVEFLSSCRSDEAPGCRTWEGAVSK